MYENILVNGFQPLLDDHFPWSFSDEDEPLNQFKKILVNVVMMRVIVIVIEIKVNAPTKISRN